MRICVNNPVSTERHPDTIVGHEPLGDGIVKPRVNEVIVMEKVDQFALSPGDTSVPIAGESQITRLPDVTNPVAGD